MNTWQLFAHVEDLERNEGWDGEDSNEITGAMFIRDEDYERFIEKLEIEEAQAEFERTHNFKD